jgi:hypothetical protein
MIGKFGEFGLEKPKSVTHGETDFVQIKVGEGSKNFGPVNLLVEKKASYAPKQDLSKPERSIQLMNAQGKALRAKKS